MFSVQQKAIIRKDLLEVLRNRQVLIPIIIVPAIMMILLPAFLFIAAGYAGDSPRDAEDLLNNPLIYLPYTDISQNIVYVVMNYYLPAFFLLIPVMAGSIIGASCFISEKEHHTLETLFYCPITPGELFRAKVTATFILSFGVSLLAFLLLGITANIGGWFYFGHLIFPNLKWMIVLLWLSPSVMLLALTLIVWISAKAKTFQGSQQIVGLLVLPFIMLIVGQSVGLFAIGEFMILIGGGLFYSIGYLLLRLAVRKFRYEKLLN